MWRQIKKDGHWLRDEDVQRLRMYDGTEHIRHKKQHGALRGSVKGRGWVQLERQVGPWIRC